MPLTPDQIEQLATAPQSVTVDGNTATRGPAVDLIALLNFAAARQRIATGRPSMRSFKTVPPGSVAGWSGTPRYY